MSNKAEISNNFWKDKNVFLTGGTGFLGSYLAKSLINKKANLIVLVRDAVSLKKSNLYQSDEYKNITFVSGDLTDYALILRALGEYEIDTVFHLAAQAIVSVSNRNPLSTFESNIRGTWTLLEASRQSPLVKRMIVASSDKAYGDQPILPYNEKMPLQGKHPYDVSKSCTDLIAQAYNKTFGLPVCITRCANLYGGGDMNFNRIIPQTIRSILNGERVVIRSDGLFVRDYFYVEDAAEAYMLLAEQLAEKNLGGEAFNFGNEKPFTVLEVVQQIIKILGSDTEPIILNQANNEIKSQYLSAEKARITLDWSPAHSFVEGLEKTIKWYKEYLK